VQRYSYVLHVHSPYFFKRTLYRTAAKYIRYFKSFKLVYSEKYSTRKEAMQREYKLKKWTRSEKEALIDGDLKSLKKL